MRVATMIISLCAAIIAGIQSCAILVTGSLAKDPTMAGLGAIGVLIALSFILSAVFAIGLPEVSRFVFGVDALLGLILGFISDYSGLILWGGVAFGLILLSHCGVKEKAKQFAARV